MTSHKFDPLVKAKLAILLNSCIMQLLTPSYVTSFMNDPFIVKWVKDNFSRVLQWVSEYRTNLVFKW